MTIPDQKDFRGEMWPMIRDVCAIVNVNNWAYGKMD